MMDDKLRKIAGDITWKHGVGSKCAHDKDIVASCVYSIHGGTYDGTLRCPSPSWSSGYGTSIHSYCSSLWGVHLWLLYLPAW